MITVAIVLMITNNDDIDTYNGIGLKILTARQKECKKYILFLKMEVTRMFGIVNCPQDSTLHPLALNELI
mgnify:CR=1 FL=1